MIPAGGAEAFGPTSPSDARASPAFFFLFLFLVPAGLGGFADGRRLVAGAGADGRGPAARLSRASPAGEGEKRTKKKGRQSRPSVGLAGA